jgi:hypothetical protein
VNPDERRSIDTVRVRLASGMVVLPWDSAQEFLTRCRAGQGEVHQPYLATGEVPTAWKRWTMRGT